MEELRGTMDEHDNADLLSQLQERGGAEQELDVVETPPVLFKLKKQRKREMWQFVQLATKREFWHLRPDELKSKHADFAYCSKCKASIFFQSGSNNVKQHMEKYHIDSIRAFRERQRGNADGAKINPASATSQNCEQAAKRMEIEVTEQQQQQANALMARWIAQSLRPISIVEDPGFRAYLKYIARDLGGLDLKIPGRTHVRGDIVRIAAEQRGVLKAKLRDECAYYAITTDIWTDRRLRSYISLTVHYLDQQFACNNWTLEVEHFPGKHTGAAIARVLNKTLNRWELKKAFCTKLLRDGASNAVLASNLLGVRHMSCIAHSIHLVVAGALIHKQRSSVPEEDYLHDQNDDEQFDAVDNPGETTADAPESDAEVIEALRDEACAEVESFLSESLNVVERTAMQQIRAIVQVFRQLAVKFNRSPKASNRLTQIQRSIPEYAGRQDISIGLDCPTRWNSCWDMMSRFMELKIALSHFFSYLATDAGRKEFNGVRFMRPKPAEWFAVSCLHDLLSPFAAATELLSGETYPTLAMAFPCLRSVKEKLQNPLLFAHQSELVGDEEFVPIIMKLMREVRVTVLGLFTQRFRGMSSELLWVSYLDPRLTKMARLQQEEVARAKECLLLAAVEAAKSAGAPVPDTRRVEVLLSPVPTPKKARRELYADVFGQPDAEPSAPASPVRVSDQTLRVTCESEFFCT